MMASKMAEIQAQLLRASGRASAPFAPPAPAAPGPAALSPAAPVPASPGTAASRPAPTKAPSREGMIHIGAYLHPDFKTSLRLVQARTGKDIQSLLADALNELFRAHNAPVVDR
jgi:hypothetical protein